SGSVISTNSWMSWPGESPWTRFCGSDREQASTFFVAGDTLILGLRCLVARHTETHIVRDLFGDDVAFTHRSVAGFAACPGFGVHTMAEVNESREPIDLHPRYRLLLLGGGCEFLNVRAVGLDGLVTRHAKTLRRIRHELTRFGVLVTRFALQS